MIDCSKGQFEKIHKDHNGFNYDSIQCLGYYCPKCNEFFIISGESKTIIKKLMPKIINRSFVPE